MNKVQFRRWKDFAIRMSLHGWPAREVGQKQHRQVVIPAVEDFFEHIKMNFGADIIRFESWDDSRTDHSIRDRYGHYPIGPYVCDIMSEYLNDENPFQWCGEEDEKAYLGWDELWGGRIRCCVRAGMDLASTPSGGVVGFTKADIERMYPDGVPRWVSGEWCDSNNTPIKWKEASSNVGLWL